MENHDKGAIDPQQLELLLQDLGIHITADQIPPAPTDKAGIPLFTVSKKMVDYIIIRVANPLVSAYSAVEMAGSSNAALGKWRRLPGFREWEQRATTSPITDLISRVTPQVLFRQLLATPDNHNILKLGLQVGGHLDEGTRVNVKTSAQAAAAADTGDQAHTVYLVSPAVDPNLAEQGTCDDLVDTEGDS